MPPATDVRRVIEKLIADDPLVYVDCGARGGKRPDWLYPLKRSQYIGVEADAAECDRLNAAARDGHRYIPAFLAGTAGPRRFHVTRNPACASLLPPNRNVIDAFAGFASDFDVERTDTVNTVSLDDCLEEHGVPPPDFIRLDTQGTELEILGGAERALAGRVLGLDLEVEFAPMYAGQPLFGDVDAFLRARGFQLFDLARYRVRRGGASPSVPTRGQLLWGHALYLADPGRLSQGAARRLAVVATLLDRPDLALALLEREQPGDVPPLLDRLRELLARGGGHAGDSVLEASRDKRIWMD